MLEKLNTSEQRTEAAPSLESPQNVEAQLPAVRPPSPEAAVARIADIDRRRSSELAGLHAAQAALNLPLSGTSVAISAFDEERERLHSGLQSQENQLPNNRDNKLSPDHLTATKAPDEQMQQWEELMRQLGGEKSGERAQSTGERMAPPSSTDSLRLTDQPSTKMIEGERPAVENTKLPGSDLAVAQEGLARSARDAAQEMLASMKRMQELVGTPTEEQKVEMMMEGMSYSDTVARLERFLSADSSETNERSSISPPIRQYFLELGPQETMRRAQGAEPSFMEDVAEKVRQGDLLGTVGMMESLDPIYKRARERAGDDPMFKVDMARAENVREIVRRLEKMNGGGA